MVDEQDALIASLTAKVQGVTRIRDVAHKLWRCNAVSRVWKLAESLYAQPECEKRMCAVFLFGMLAVEDAHALAVLRDDVAQDGNWRVQEVLPKRSTTTAERPAISGRCQRSRPGSRRPAPIRGGP